MEHIRHLSTNNKIYKNVPVRIVANILIILILWDIINIIGNLKFKIWKYYEND